MARLALTSDWRRSAIVAGRAIAVGLCEIGANAGTIPEWCQKATGNRKGDFWCMSSVCRSFERGQGHRSPLLMTGSCEQQRQRAIAKGAHRTREQFDAARAADPLSVAGWVGLLIGPDENGNPHAHHALLVGTLNDVGDVVTLGPRGGFLTIEGNAADPKKPSSRNGDGQYEGRERGHPDDHSTYEFIDPEAFAP